MAEPAKDVMVKDATPTKKAFISRPYSQEERLKKDEEELARLVEEQKGSNETSEEKEEGEAEPTSAEEKTFKKRYGDLRRHTQEKEQQFQKQLNDLKSQLDKATKKEMKLPKSDEDIEAWAKDYPDVAKIVETIAMKKAMEQSKALEERVKQIDEMQVSAVKDKAEAQLLSLHPDFNEIRESDDFHNWAEEQPKWVQDALYENDNDARSAARAIDLYKGDRGIGKTNKTKNDTSAAKAVNTQSTKTKIDADGSSNKIRESAVQKMSAKEYESKSESIMEAIRSGNFIYDVSGNAR